MFEIAEDIPHNSQVILHLLNWALMYVAVCICSSWLPVGDSDSHGPNIGILSDATAPGPFQHKSSKSGATGRTIFQVESSLANRKRFFDL